MIDILEHYYWRSLEGELNTSGGLTRKVDWQTGSFLPFYGNTTVFLLDSPTKQRLKKLQDELHGAAGWMLAEPLDCATFHMTLHDLENVDNRTRGDTRSLEERMVSAEAQAKRLLQQWRNDPPLRMRTTHLFNMVNTSIVLGLVPADEDSWQRLSRMYQAMETVKPLGYKLTPHITMAYYRPGSYPADALEGLRTALKPVEMEVILKMEDLVYQVFTDMNHYR